MEDSFKFRHIKHQQVSGFLFPHEYEAQRINGAKWCASVAAFIAFFILPVVSLLLSDIGPFVIGVVLWAIAETRWKLLDYRLSRFMQGSGL